MKKPKRKYYYPGNTYFHRYPRFDSDILFVLQLQRGLLLFENILDKLLDFTDLTVKIRIVDKEESIPNYQREWIDRISSVTMFINRSFLINHHNESSNSYKLFISEYPSVFNILSGMIKDLKQIIKSDNPYHRYIFYSVVYRTNEKEILQFLFGFEDLLNQEKSIIDLINTMSNYDIKKDEQFRSIVKKTVSQKSKIKYFEYVNDRWIIIDPLKRISQEINHTYIQENDTRVNKPYIDVHQDDFNQYIQFDKNWVLSSDSLRTLMVQPNDVSIYSNISSTFLKKGKKFFDETIIPRLSYYSGSYPTPEKQKEYFNYFETIIISLIFSYTSIESFVNICIPFNYRYNKRKEGEVITYDKTDIERNFNLREKLKTILRDILMTPDPSKEKWWSNFVKLENIRNEIIHTKQSKSEETYSKLLSQSIFEIIPVNIEIIKYYGKYISKNKEELLVDFPYGFGFDEFIPSLLTEKSYNEFMKILQNPKSESDEN